GGAVPGAPVTIVNSETGLTRSVTTDSAGERSEEHTSELQSLTNLVCRLLLEKKNPGVRCPVADLSPDDVDILFVRDNSEGLYAAAGAIFSKRTRDEVVLQERVNTGADVQRCLA